MSGLRRAGEGSGAILLQVLGQVNELQEELLISPTSSYPAQTQAKTEKVFTTTSLFCPPPSPDQARAEWQSETTGGGFSTISQKQEYKQILQGAQLRLGLTDTEERLTPRETTLLENVSRAAQALIKEGTRKSSKPEAIKNVIEILEENIYELLALPVAEVAACMKASFKMFKENQDVFRRALQEALGKVLAQSSKALSNDHDAIMQSVIDAIPIKALDKIQKDLTNRYPNEINVIQIVTQAAKSCMEQVQRVAKEGIKDYQDDPDICFCFTRIFTKRRDLKCKYDEMLEGRYRSFADIPQGDTDKIYRGSYTASLIALVKACSQFELEKENIEGALQVLTEECQSYLKGQSKKERFQQIVSLATFLQPLKNIHICPLLQDPTYSLTPREAQYLIRNLYTFMFTTNTRLERQPLIPYKYTKIGEQEKAQARATVKSKRSSTEEKREACRILFHANIPWKALAAVGSLAHGSGGVSEAVRTLNEQKLREALPDLLPELVVVEEALAQLIEFEAGEFDQPLAVIPPQEVSVSSYAHLYLLGDIAEMKRSLEKIQTLLKGWINLPLPEGLTLKHHYGLLRTVQILGEMSKNLRQAGILSRDEIWDTLEELRDLLSHSERISLVKRLDPLMTEESDSHRRFFYNLLADFQTLQGYFGEKASLIAKVKTWQDCKGIHQKGKDHLDYLQLTGIEDLSISLTAKILPQEQENLLATLVTKQAQQAREQMIGIRDAFFNKTSTREELDEKKAHLTHLPLTKAQKKTLEEGLKVMANSSAATNNARDAKVGMCTLMGTLVKELFKEKKLQPVEQVLLELQATISQLDPLGDEDPFKTKVEEAKRQVEQIREYAKEKSVKGSTSLRALEENLSNVTETTQVFVERKRVECEELLDILVIAVDATAAKEKGEELLRSMQLKPKPEEETKLLIKGYGISAKEESLWMKAHAKCVKKSSLIEAEKEEKERDAKDKALDSIIAIEKRLQALDKIFWEISLEKFAQDKLLQLASQYLLADFRNAASMLELQIDSLRSLLEKHLDAQFLRDLQRDLSSSITEGNDLLHVHEVTEPGMLTAAGHELKIYSYITNILKNVTVGKRQSVVMDSFGTRLGQLRSAVEKL